MRFAFIIAAMMCAMGIRAYAAIQQDVVERDTIGSTGGGGGGDLSGGDLDDGELCIYNLSGDVIDCNVPASTFESAGVTASEVANTPAGGIAATDVQGAVNELDTEKPDKSKIKTLFVFRPTMNEPPVANFATIDTRNSHPVLDFDGSTNESAVFTFVMPQAYSGGGVTVYIHYAMTSATSGDIDWDVAFEKIGDGQQDLDADGFASVQSVDNTAVPGASGLVDVVSVSFTDGAQMDSCSAGDVCRIKLTRDAASDTDNSDAELVAMELRES